MKFKWTALTLSAIAVGAILGNILPDFSDLIHFGWVVPWISANGSNPALRVQVLVVSILDWYIFPSLTWLILITVGFSKMPHKGRMFVYILVGSLIIGILANFYFTGHWLPGGLK